MADSKISALPASTTPLAGTETLPVVQSGVTKKVSVANLTAGRDVNVNSLTSAGNVYAGGTAILIGDGATNSAILYATGGPVKIFPNASNTFNFTTDGNLTPLTAAKGVNFTANTPAAGMTSQLLNWYEEGTWTPSDQSGAGLTFTGASGTYTRVGNTVRASFTLTYPSTASGVQNYISLPINSNGGGGMYITYTNYGAAICGYVDGTNNRFVVADFSGNALTNANLSGKRIDGVVIYRAA